jgi:ribosomal protein L34
MVHTFGIYSPTKHRYALRLDLLCNHTETRYNKCKVKSSTPIVPTLLASLWAILAKLDGTTLSHYFRCNISTKGTRKIILARKVKAREYITYIYQKFWHTGHHIEGSCFDTVIYSIVIVIGSTRYHYEILYIYSRIHLVAK